MSPQWILIGAGIYKEAINVTRKGPTTLLGATNHADKCTLIIAIPRLQN
jgi:pectin methylesterase-like acyl-CoA thioesterase